MLFKTTLIAALVSLAAGERLAYSFCNYCSPPTSPGGAPSCNTNIYQHEGDGDGGCDTGATGDIADGGCTRSDAVDTPRGSLSYEVASDCESKGPGEMVGSMYAYLGPIQYNCYRTEGEYSNFCGLTFACARFMECIST
jgi:hypothetical protein